jgi:lipopolysaccharide biosynthesis glycosyltransferase
MSKRKIYIGFDPKERLAYDVARSSFLRTSASPKLLSIVPLERQHLPMLTRPIERKDGKLWCPISQAPMATEFAISRFCVPFLQKKGWALFVDCDIVCVADIEQLFALADPQYAVMVVKHQQEAGAATKMDGQIQTYYSRKNWSSVVLWNLDHPANKKLTVTELNTWPGRDLHAFKWLKDEEIGALPAEWNLLVGVESFHAWDAKLLHYTLGGPWLENWKEQPFDDIWHLARKHL